MENYENERLYMNTRSKLTKGSRLEHARIFEQSFTKYKISSNKFSQNKNLKYVNQLGGVPLGQTEEGEEILVDSSDVHSLIIGSTGSKKSRLIVMPNIYILGAAGESMIVSDPKAEIYSRTAYKTIVYLIMPDEKTSYHQLVTLFIKQSYEYLIYKAQVNPDGKMKIRVNYILDEFSSLPTIKDFPAMITAARSRNIRFNLVIQSKHQLLERYREETDTIQSNCTNWIFFTSREIQLLEELSMLCGKCSNEEKFVLPLASLQHFNKEKGEALILSGRLYPYISLLADIDKYDNGKYSFLEFEKEERKGNTLISFKNQEREIDQNNIEENEDIGEIEEEYDFQKELEAKFDELFGTDSSEEE